MPEPRGTLNVSREPGAPACDLAEQTRPALRPSYAFAPPKLTSRVSPHGTAHGCCMQVFCFRTFAPSSVIDRPAPASLSTAHVIQPALALSLLLAAYEQHCTSPAHHFLFAELHGCAGDLRHLYLSFDFLNTQVKRMQHCLTTTCPLLFQVCPQRATHPHPFYALLNLPSISKR